MAKHIWINQERLEKARKTLTVDGVDFSVEISPFDAPREIVGQYDKTTGYFEISFKYDDSEPTSSSSHSNDGIEFREGRYSGKLMKILIPVDKKDLAVITLQTRVMKALAGRRLAFPKKSVARDLNQSVAEDVLSSDFKNFESELLAT